MTTRKIVLSLFLLSLFLCPQIEKVTHKHDDKHRQIAFDAKMQLHELSEKCAICHFEFSLFQLPDLGIAIWKDIQIFYRFVLFHSILLFECTNLHTVRGPPYYLQIYGLVL